MNAIKSPIKIPKEYKPLFSDNYLYYVFYGGRGGGKTENIALSLILLSLTKKLRILCIREAQSSLAESVKSVLEKWVWALELQDFFTIGSSSIKSAVGSEFIFMGMRSYNAVNVKSITGINITWIEEAEAFSKRSWQLLVPSVIRTENPKIVISFNPYREDDVIYREFVANTPPARSYICKVGFEDNPFFAGTPLEAQMLDDKSRLPESEFRHTWHGELVKFTEDSLFRDADFKEYPSEFLEFAKMVIACDPATTNKDYSNEYGVVVLGKTKEGLIIILEDLSGNMSPLEFVEVVKQAKRTFNCNNVVVEVNNGGDFIKATLLQGDPTLNVIEVRAGSDKVQRALPVANLMSIGKVRMGKDLPKLARQMRLITHKGFAGSRGESPDRLDALVWGVYELAEIRDKDSIYTIFDAKWFAAPAEYVKGSFVSRKNVLYLKPVGDVVAGIVFNLHQVQQDLRLEIVDSMILDSFADLRGDFETIYCADIPAAETIFRTNPNIIPYSTLKERKLDEVVRNILPIVRESRLFIAENAKVRSYNNTTSMLLQTELMEFKYNSDRKFALVWCFCDIIYSEFNLKKD